MSQPLLKLIAGEQPLLNVQHAILSAPVRHIFMMGVIWYLTRKKKSIDMHILEIGSWMGASTLSWAQGLKLHNAAQGHISCIDAWQPFFNRETHQHDLYTQMELALTSDTAYQIYNHNMRTLPASITCQHFRGKSANILPVLKPQNFDVVFIDGDHTYSAVLKDIQQSLSLIKENGIICGDDLNLQLFEIDQDHAIKHAEYDFIQDPLTQRNYHPGVSLAVGEVFEKVSSWGGFWAMQKRENSWRPISLKNMPIHYPAHFPADAIQKAKAHLNDIEIT